MGIFISVPKTIECVVAAVLFSVALSATYVKLLGILQISGYRNKKLFCWLGKKNNQAFAREILLFMLCALSYSVIALCFSFAKSWAAVAALSAYILFFVLYVIADKKIALRSPVSFTPRLKRLYAVSFFMTAVISYIFVTLLNFADELLSNEIFTLLRYLPLSLLPLLSAPVIALSNLVCAIYEVPHNKSFVRAAKKKLAESGLKVIGVTGSYAKTSVKRILTDMLSKKYRVLATPRSHNTPMGLALTVNSNDLENYDILIAEMGARRLGDIAELCEFCPPDYSVITGICPQHLESFGSVENIVSAKGEILSATKECAVIAPDCYGLFADYPCRKIKGDGAFEIDSTCDGTAFTLDLGGEKRVIKTRLLGEHSASNIALAARLAYILGVSADDIVSAAEELEFVEHRLQLIRSNGVNIIDDGYNSNVRGAAAALKVLRSFGGAKICVTPGLVELGILEESENYALGKELVGLDAVILVGDTLITPVRKGYTENGGDIAVLYTAPTLSAAEEILKQTIKTGDAVLFLNDLPDIY